MSALEAWVGQVVAELGLEESDGEVTTLVLDVARDVAHGVARPAAPVTAYLLGVAVGRGADPVQAAAAIVRLAAAPPGVAED